MNFTPHSPAPWRRGLGNDCNTVFDAQGSVVAERCGTIDGALIAGAPQMLEACRHLEAFCEMVFCHGRGLSIDGKPVNHTDINKAREAAQRAFKTMSPLIPAQIGEKRSD